MMRASSNPVSGHHGNLRKRNRVKPILILPRPHSAPPLVWPWRSELIPHLLLITEQINNAMRNQTYHLYKPPPPCVPPWGVTVCPRPLSRPRASPPKCLPSVPLLPGSSGLPCTSVNEALPKTPPSVPPKISPSYLPQNAPPRVSFRAPPIRHGEPMHVNEHTEGHSNYVSPVPSDGGLPYARANTVSTRAPPKVPPKISPQYLPPKAPSRVPLKAPAVPHGVLMNRDEQFYV